MGEKVRYDGGDKRDCFLTETFGRHVEWVPVCPEVEIGMGIPREAGRLVGDPPKPRMIAERSGKDWTAQFNPFAAKRVQALTALDLATKPFAQLRMNRAIAAQLHGVAIDDAARKVGV